MIRWDVIAERPLVRHFAAMGPVPRAHLFLAALAVALAVYLVFGGKPWEVEVPEGRNPRVGDFVTVWAWWAALINLLVCGFLAVTARWWAAPFSARRVSAPPTPRWMWAVVAASMALALWMALPRLGQSLWHDEGYPVRHAILGDYKISGDGSPVLKEAKWQETVFYFKKPNHVPLSVLSRIFNDTWRTIARPTGLQFNETVLRIPVLIAGLLAIPAMALFLARAGFPAAGAVAAVLAALHPWMVRYTTEGRSYAFVILLLLLLFYCCLRLLENGRWRWWSAYGAGSFLMLWFYPTTIFVLVVLNAVVLPSIWLRWKDQPGAAGSQTWRWLAANVLAAMLYLQVMLPCIPQFLRYVDSTYSLGQVDLLWMQNFLAYMVSGSPWTHARVPDSPYFELWGWAVHHPGLMALAGLLAAGALAVGIWRLAGKGHGLLALPMLLPAALCIAEARMRDGHLFEWYVIFALPGAIALVSIGLTAPLEVARSRASKTAALLFLVAVLAAFTIWTSPKREVLRTKSMQPNRESVLASRPVLDPHDPVQKTILTATFFGRPDPYDPNIQWIRGRKGLEEIIRRADAENKPLSINLGYLATVVIEHAHKYAFLKESGFFESPGIMHGNEPIMSRHVFHYIPGSAKDFDFSSIPIDRGSPGKPEN